MLYANNWYERAIKEIINLKAKEGYTTIRFPTVATTAAIEGFERSLFIVDDARPYEVPNNSREDLNQGDLIKMDGIDYKVVDTSDRDNSIVVAANSGVEVVDRDAVTELIREENYDYVIDRFISKINKYIPLKTVKDIKKVFEWQDLFQDYQTYLYRQEKISFMQKNADEYNKIDNTDYSIDEIIEIQEYFNIASENFAKKRRSLGIGITNLAAYLAKNELKYTSDKTLIVLDEWMEYFQYYLLKSSLELAKEKGRWIIS